MLQSLLNAWRLPDLRKKLLFTAMIIAIYRLGCYVPVPGVSVKSIEAMFNSGGIFDFYNLFSGGGLQRVAIFAMGIMPYITASIIMQLLTMVIPRLEALMKEGEAGQKKVNQYTRYFTVVLASGRGHRLRLPVPELRGVPGRGAAHAPPLLPHRLDAHGRHGSWSCGWASSSPSGASATASRS